MIFTRNNEIINEETMSIRELANMICDDELHIVFGYELYEHLLETNVRFKGDNSRVVNIRNVYKDGRNGKPIQHFFEPSLKYNKSKDFGKEGLPIVIPKVFNGKLEIQGEAAKHHSISEIDETGKKIIKTILKEECNLLNEYWFINPDESSEALARFEELKSYFINKYATRRF